MTVSRPRRILSLSRDTRLLITRNDMLAHDGYEVHSPRTPAQAIPLLARGQFDAVVCGHSIQKEHRDRLLCEIRARYPTIPIIFVYDKPNGGDPTTPADVSVNVGEPTNLVQALNELFSHSS